MKPGGEWPEFHNIGSGYLLVSPAFRELLESTTKTDNSYQFLKPNFILENAPEYFIMNLIHQLDPIANENAPTMMKWKFKKSVVGQVDHVFRADGAGTAAVAGVLADRIANANLKGLYLMKIPVVD